MPVKKIIVFCLLPVLLLLNTPNLLPQEKISYIIGPEDVLDLSVWQHPELNRVVTVRPDGKISFSLIGDVNASGLTPAELDEAITKKLSKYVQNPEVTVIVSTVGIRSKQVLVLGQVARPGPYLVGEDVTVLEAIAMAGSYTETASLEKVTVTRRRAGESPKVTEANLKKVILGGNATEDFTVMPGDIVYVPKKTSAWNIFDRWFIGGILPIMAFFVMIDTLGRD